MTYIINPVTFEKYSIFSQIGINLLKNYVKLYQTGGTGGAARGALPSNTIDLPDRTAAAAGMNCPKIEIEDGTTKYLSISKYDEEAAEVAGYNNILENQEIGIFLKTRERPTVLTWILCQNAPTASEDRPTTIRNTPAQNIYTLFAVHNESIYEFSAKHNTILHRMGKADMLYIASGEFLYEPGQEGNVLYFNFQSSLFYETFIVPDNRYEEGSYRFMLQSTLNTLLYLAPEIQFIFSSKTFIEKINIVDPEYLKKLTKMKNEGIVTFELSDNEDECKKHVGAFMNRIRINLLETNIATQMRRFENKEIPTYIQPYITRLRTQIYTLKQKLPSTADSAETI
jgi:hypothetical protein